MIVIPSGTAPGGNMASIGMAIWIDGSAKAQFAFGVLIGVIVCPRWTFLSGLGAVSVSTTTAGVASATRGRTGICLTVVGWNTRSSTAAAAALARRGTQR